jgi:hypothetical protein
MAGEAEVRWGGQLGFRGEMHSPRDARYHEPGPRLESPRPSLGFHPTPACATLLPAMTKFLIAWCAIAGTVSVAAFDHSHEKLDRLLKQHVRNARVDYAALKTDRQPLDAYLLECSVVKEPDFRQWTEQQQLAFLINLYNAATLQLVASHYPVPSIKKIGGWFKGPWDQECVRVFGRTTTLDDLEHGMLRRNYREPRIHFAIVCAAQGCPPLRPEAYTAARLNQQLEEQARAFLRQRASNRVEPGQHTVYLSPIFKWFREDFENAEPILKFLAPYFPAEDQQRLAAERDWKIRYTEYDWSLNDASRN